MKGIRTHPNYNLDYELVVVCGQEASLLDLIKDNLQAFIKTDLIYFQLLLLVFNLMIFITFTMFFERRL